MAARELTGVRGLQLDRSRDDEVSCDKSRRAASQAMIENDSDSDSSATNSSSGSSSTSSSSISSSQRTSSTVRLKMNWPRDHQVSSAAVGFCGAGSVNRNDASGQMHNSANDGLFEQQIFLLEQRQEQIQQEIEKMKQQRQNSLKEQPVVPRSAGFEHRQPLRPASHGQQQRAPTEEQMQQLIRLQQKTHARSAQGPTPGSQLARKPPQGSQPLREHLSEQQREQQRMKRSQKMAQLIRMQTLSGLYETSDTESQMTTLSSLTCSTPSLRPSRASYLSEDRTDGLGLSRPLALDAESLLSRTPSSDVALRPPRAIIEELSSDTDPNPQQVIVRHLPASYFGPGTPESQRANQKPVTQFRRSGSMVLLNTMRRYSMKHLESIDSGIDNTAFSESTNNSSERAPPKHVIINTPPLLLDRAEKTTPVAHHSKLPSMEIVFMVIVLILLLAIGVSIIIAFIRNT